MGTSSRSVVYLMKHQAGDQVKLPDVGHSFPPCRIVTFDPEGIVTIWNPAAERAFGWSRDEALGMRLPFVPAERQAGFLTLRRGALLGEAFTEPELHRRRADGSPIVVSVSTAPLRRPDGAILRDRVDPDGRHRSRVGHGRGG